MSHYSSHYRDGQEIHAGDLFLNGQEECQVTVVFEWNECLPGWESWLDVVRRIDGPGFMYEASYGPVFERESNEDQVLISRKQS